MKGGRGVIVILSQFVDLRVIALVALDRLWLRSFFMSLSAVIQRININNVNERIGRLPPPTAVCGRRGSSNVSKVIFQ
jgi:hypothetical protein